MVKRNYISCVIILVILFSFLEMPVMSDKGQSPVSQLKIMYYHKQRSEIPKTIHDHFGKRNNARIRNEDNLSYFIPMNKIMQEKEESDVKSSHVIMTSVMTI